MRGGEPRPGVKRLETRNLAQRKMLAEPVRGILAPTGNLWWLFFAINPEEKEKGDKLVLTGKARRGRGKFPPEQQAFRGREESEREKHRNHEADRGCKKENSKYVWRLGEFVADNSSPRSRSTGGHFAHSKAGVAGLEETKRMH